MRGMRGTGFVSWSGKKVPCLTWLLESCGSDSLETTCNKYMYVANGSQILRTRPEQIKQLNIDVSPPAFVRNLYYSWTLWPVTFDLEPCKGELLSSNFCPVIIVQSEREIIFFSYRPIIKNLGKILETTIFYDGSVGKKNYFSLWLDYNYWTEITGQ